MAEMIYGMINTQMLYIVVQLGIGHIYLNTKEIIALLVLTANPKLREIFQCWHIGSLLLHNRILFKSHRARHDCNCIVFNCTVYIWAINSVQTQHPSIREQMHMYSQETK